MADLFISYNREDQERARLFAEGFEAAGYSVWWDVGLRVGEAYDQVTEDALRAARAVIVLWSTKSVASRWVRAEATLANKAGTFFPCMIEPCERPIMFELTQTADLSHWRGDADDPAWRVFLADLKRFLDGEAAGPSTSAERLAARPRTPPKSLSIDRRTALAAGAAAIAVGVGSIAFFKFTGRPLASNGIAVLPFRNISGDQSQDFLCAGLSSEVRSALARNAALRVVAKASCEAVRMRALGAAEMAKELAVSFILDGDVRLGGERLSVSTELIDGKTGFSRWAQSFDMPMAELATVQSAIAMAVMRQLSARDESHADKSGYGATDDASAFEDYLMGNDLYARAASLEEDLDALARFDRAILRDPFFGAAHAARARSLTSLGNTADNVEKAHEYYEAAVKAATRAVEVGPQSADAYATLGFALFQAQLKVKEAREPYEKARALGRGEAHVLAMFAAYAAATKHHGEAFEAVTRARELDPLNATIHRAVGFVHYAAGDFEKSIEPVTRALELNPALSDSHARIASALVALGRESEALPFAEKEKSGLMRFPALAIILRRTGDIAGADAAMKSLIDKYGDAGLYQQAQVLARWGEADRAMAVLANAKKLGDSGLTYAFIDPALESLRKRPDFEELLKGLGFI